MRGNGNGFMTLLEKLYFMLIPTSQGRSKYIMKQACRFRKVGSQIFWQPRKFPTDPEFISLGNNVTLSSGVEFINHDIISSMLNRKYKSNDFVLSYGCIEIGDNVMIGANTIILPNVKIGSNVIIGAGSVVSRDIPDNCIAAGVPAKVIGDFDKLVLKRAALKDMTIDDIWAAFHRIHK